MNKLVPIMVLAAATATTSCKGSTTGSKPAATPSTAAPAAGTKNAWIHFTKNYNPGTGAGRYSTDCIGIVSTETIGAQKGFKIIWHIDTGHMGEDACPMLDNSKINLRFATDVMGMAAMRKLMPMGSASVIEGTISNSNAEAPDGPHKYQVFIDNDPAGPDPEIDVGCEGCGPPGGPGE